MIEEKTDEKNETTKKYKILVVDDESEIRDFLEWNYTKNTKYIRLPTA